MHLNPMHIKTILITLSLSIFFLTNSFAQDHVIKGSVLDSLDNVPLDGASVRLLNSKDSLISNHAADKDGKFSLKIPKEGQYYVQVNYLGYRSYKKLHDFSKDSYALTIHLALNITTLDEVNITAPEPVVRVMGDTTEFRASAFSTEAYADADALVKQIPGVEIDSDGNVKVLGEDVKRIIVDGKEFFSTDPRVALKNLPADIIDKIQLIDERSKESRFSGFDDGNRSKIINIVTKPDKRTGYFGRLAGGLGNADRYSANGMFNFFSGPRRLSIMSGAGNTNEPMGGGGMIMGGGSMSMGGGGGRGGRGGRGGGGAVMMMGGGGFGGGGGGVGDSFSNNWGINLNNDFGEKIVFSADYSSGNNENRVFRNVNQELLIGPEANQFNKMLSENSSDSKNHRASLRFEYEIDSTQSLSFNPNFSIQNSGSINSSNNSSALKTEEPINASQRSNTNNSKNFQWGGDLSYRLRLGKQGRTLSLSANGNQSTNKGYAQTLSYNQYFEDYVLNRADTVNNENINRGDNNGLSGRLSYTEPLGEKNRLQANYSIRNTARYSNRETFDFLQATGQFSELNKQLSNEFRNDYVYHSGGLAFQMNKDPLSFDFGMDIQSAKSTDERIFPETSFASRSFNSYLPKANLTYRFTQQQNVRVEYNTATNAPSINQLQEVINNENPLYIQTGNADLKQEYRHSFRVNYSSADRETGANFSANANVDFANNSIVNSTFIASADTTLAPEVILGKGGQFSRPENVNGNYSARANLSFGRPIKSLKLNVNANTGLSYNHGVGLLNNNTTFSDNYNINQRVSVNSNISQKFIFGLSYSGNYSISRNNTNQGTSYNSYNQNIRNDFTVVFWKGIRLNSAVTYNYTTGQGEGFNQSFVLWNASIGKKLFSKEQAEITLSASDILNKNVTINRTVNDRYIEDSQSNMLSQYFILSFTYNLRKFGLGGGGGEPRGDRESRGNRGGRMSGGSFIGS